MMLAQWKLIRMPSALGFCFDNMSGRDWFYGYSRDDGEELSEEFEKLSQVEDKPRAEF